MYVVKFEAFALIQSPGQVVKVCTTSVSGRTYNIRPMSPTLLLSVSRAASSRTRIPRKNVRAVTLAGDNAYIAARRIRFWHRCCMDNISLRLVINIKQKRWHSRVTKQELLVSDAVLVPSGEVYGLRAVDDASLFRQFVYGILPEIRNQFYDGMCAVDNSCVGAVVDSKLEGAWCGKR